ncbi:MAG: tRNA (adenosine(37)-N6)-dimethylallyltransferase MiaA [Bacteroidales bacterium]|nr:tRNA (adenosine(37)-N6)-dimethylallyltransferase MiaA [Bacteroidales bacterium]
MGKNILPIIIGPTATGKTRLAALVAADINAEVICADSRQVYRDMNLGTGKDYDDYIVNGRKIPYHLMDIVDAGEKFNLFKFFEAFQQSYKDIVDRGKQPLVCGGTGMYVESIIKNYNMHPVPEDLEFRKSCESRSFEDLTEELKNYKTLHNTTDLDTKKRLVRALEIARYERLHPVECKQSACLYVPLTIGVSVSREVRRERIERRFKERLASGMTDEVEALLAKGVLAETLIYYGLEYKYLTLYVTGKITRNEMEEQLLTAIFQFAKRQMTWFRGMERRGINIHWIDGELPMDERKQAVEEIISNAQCVMLNA